MVLSAGAVRSAAILLSSADENHPQVGKPLRPGWPQLHEPQLFGGAGAPPFQAQSVDLSEDPAGQRLLPDGRTEWRTARQYPAARQDHRPDPRCEFAAAATARALDRRSLDRSLCHVGGSTQSRKPRDGAERSHHARLEAVELGGAPRSGRQAEVTDPESRLPGRALASLRPPHALPSMRHGAHGFGPDDERGRQFRAQPRSSQSLHRRRVDPADLGRRQPALTIAALALRSGQHIIETEFSQ